MDICVNESRHQSHMSVMFTEEEARIPINVTNNQ